MALSETLARFMNDPCAPYAPKLFGRSKQDPELQLSPSTTIPSKPCRSSKGEQAVSNSASSEQSTSPSTSSSSSILSRQESESSNTSTAPSDVVESLVGDVATMSAGGHDQRLQCLLKDITGCHASFPESERGLWHSHSLSHYALAPPPTHAICIFCPAVFKSNDPFACWLKRMNHIAEHLETDKTIEQGRPDFRVIKDMFSKGCISEEDYKHFIAYSERPECDGLRPHDYIPEELKKKQRAAYEEANRVVVKDPRREGARGYRPLVAKKSKSRSTAIVT